MLFTPEHPMSAETAIGLSGASANAVNANTSSEVARYILGDSRKPRKHLLNESYDALVERIAHVVEWERIYKSAFGLALDMESLVVPLMPLVPFHEFIIDARELTTPLLFNKCRELFCCEFTGTAWDHMAESMSNRDFRSVPINQPLRNSLRPSYEFMNQIYASWCDYGGHCPKGLWVSTELTFPHDDAGNSIQPFCNTGGLERSRSIGLREYLIYIILDWTKAARQGKQKEWTPPHKNSKIWCFGSHGNDLYRSEDRNLHVRGVFYPTVYWKGRRMMIDCTAYGEHYAKTGGTIYVLRTNP